MVQPLPVNLETIDGNPTSNADGLVASGDTTGAEDTAAIQARLNAGGHVQLPAGTFYINAPLTVPPHTSLAGTLNTSLVSETSAGTTIKPVADFSSSLGVSAAIVLLGKQEGGYSTSSEEQKIYHLQIVGTSSPAGTNGINSYGGVGRVRLDHVLISQMPGNGVVQTTTANGGPDAWQAETCNVRYCGGHGWVVRSSDSVYLNCKSSNNATNAGLDCDWCIETCSNTKFEGCASEHSGAVGFGYVCLNSGTDCGRVMFVGCSTDQSARHGIQIGGTFNNNTSFAHAFPVLISGCTFGRDGQDAGSGGNYAGIYVNAYGTRSGGLVMVSGTHVWPGVNDDGSGVLAPNHGIWVQGGSKVAIGGGSSAFAATGGTAIFDDSSFGTNTINYDNSVMTGVGATASMGVTTSPNIASYQGRQITLTPGAAPTSDPVRIVNANSGERSIGISVSGQDNDKIKVTSDGKIAFGPGSAAQDTAFQRGAAGRLDVSTTDAAGTFAPLDPYGGGFGFLGFSGQLGHPNSQRASYTVTNAAVSASGTVYLVAYYLPAGTTVTNVNMLTGTRTLKTGGTHGWYVLCDSSRVVRAASADQTDAATVWGTASTVYTLAVSPAGGGQFVTTYSGLYYLGIMVATSSGTQPNMAGTATAAGGVAGAAPFLCGATSTVNQTTPPAADGTVTIGSSSGDGSKNFCCWVT